MFQRFLPRSKGTVMFLLITALIFEVLFIIYAAERVMTHVPASTVVINATGLAVIVSALPLILWLMGDRPTSSVSTFWLWFCLLNAAALTFVRIASDIRRSLHRTA